MTAAIVVGVLVAAGVYLVLQKELVRAVLGFMLLGHAANVILLSAGGMHRREPALLGDGVPAEAADPLPQAFALTAIVITFAVTVYLLVLGLRTHEHDDDHDDDHPADTTGSPPDEGTTVPAARQGRRDGPARTRPDLASRARPEQEAP